MRVSGPKASWVVTFSGFALMLLALMPPGDVSGDGASMLAVTNSLVVHGSFAVPCQSGIPGQGGQCFSTFYPLQSILAVPFMALGRGAARVVHAPISFLGNFAGQAVPALAAAGVSAFTVYFAGEFGASRTRALMAGVTVAFASEVAVYYRSFFADVLAALMACILVYGFLRGRRAIASAGVILLILTKPQLMPVGLLVGLVVARHRRQWAPLFDAAGATISGALLYAGYNILRFGDPTNFGGSAREIHHSALALGKLIDALGLLTISPGRGFLWYSPIVLAGLVVVARRRDLLAQVAVAVLLGALLLHLANPGLGFEWGSRYLVPAIPLLAAAAWTLRGPVPWVLAAVGLVLVLPTFAVFYARYYAEQAEAGHAPSSHVYWSIPDSEAVGVWGAAGRAISAARVTDVYALARAPNVPTPAGGGVRVSDQRFFTVVAQWWWMTPAGHVPRIVGLLAALAMFGTGALVLCRSVRTPIAPAPMRPS